MYIAFPCPVCSDRDVVFTMESREHWCTNEKCRYSCSSEDFWHIYNTYVAWRQESSAAAQRFLRSQPEWHIDNIFHCHSLAVSWKVRGRTDSYEKMVEEVNDSIKALLEDHGVCFCGWRELDEITKKWERLAAEDK